MTRWVTAALLSGALALTACEAEPAEPAEPSSSAPASSEPTSAAPTAEPTGPVEPTLPPEAEANTKAGAEAFVEYWWDLVNYAQASGDTAKLRSATAASCPPCNAGREWIDDVYNRGGTIRGGILTITEMSVGRTSDGGGWHVVVELATTRQVVRGAGPLNGEYGTEERTVLMVVRLTDVWRVTTMDVR